MPETHGPNGNVDRWRIQQAEEALEDVRRQQGENIAKHQATELSLARIASRLEIMEGQLKHIWRAVLAVLTIGGMAVASAFFRLIGLPLP